MPGDFMDRFSVLQYYRNILTSLPSSKLPDVAKGSYIPAQLLSPDKVSQGLAATMAEQLKEIVKK